jgi:hypothetical protein
MKLQKDKTPQMLLSRVRSGEMRTRAEWAREFGTAEAYIDVVLSGLRKRNYMLYPIGGTNRTQGVVREVVNKDKDYRETSERIHKGFTKPHVTAAFRLRENYLIKSPGRRAEIEMTATEFVRFVQEQSQKLLKGN